jgi:hypothetical protein
LYSLKDKILKKATFSKRLDFVQPGSCLKSYFKEKLTGLIIFFQRILALVWLSNQTKFILLTFPF